jgi:hypothetical protein
MIKDSDIKMAVELLNTHLNKVSRRSYNGTGTSRGGSVTGKSSKQLFASARCAIMWENENFLCLYDQV